MVQTEGADSISNLQSGINTMQLALMSVITTIFRDTRITRFYDTYNQIGSLPTIEPLNRVESLEFDFKKVLNDCGVKAPDTSSIYPYWDYNHIKPYDPLEVFGTLIQFLDYHNAPLPTTVLPPSNDVRQFIEKILAVERPALIGEQLKTGLDIADNNVVGAANLACIASRLIGRGMDSRAYPDIAINEKDMLKWGKKVTQFETYNQTAGDSAGDTYYFWTHAMAGLVYNLYDSKIIQLIFQNAFENGTNMMVCVSKFIGLPTTSPHYEASLLGRAIGLSLSNPDWYNSDSSIIS